MLAMELLWQMLGQVGTLLYTPVFWLAVGLVYLQTRRWARMRQALFQLRRETIAGRVAATVAIGMVGGLVASVLLFLLGVSVDQVGLFYVWAVALLLMLFRQRFFCFSYAGGILALCNVLWGWPVLQSHQLLLLIAILHCTEAFLVLFSGHLQAVPIYLCDKQQRITGGFLLQMAWPLPLVMLFTLDNAVVQPQAGFLLLPEWWPVLGGGHGSTLLYILVPVLAALGYSDLAVCHSLRQKTRQSAMLLAIYSVSLCLLVWVTKDNGLWMLLPALFAPLGHEAVILYGRRQETGGVSRFIAPERGVLVLDVQHGSPAARAGLRSEDWILQLDGAAVENRKHFLSQQYLLPQKAVVRYLRKGKSRQCILRMGRWSQPGIITAPDSQCDLYWSMVEDEGIAKFLYKKLAKTLKKV